MLSDLLLPLYRCGRTVVHVLVSVLLVTAASELRSKETGLAVSAKVRNKRSGQITTHTVSLDHQRGFMISHTGNI